jgi:ABC-type multidrug transport system fused ATPase/permease subunit
MYVFLDMLVEPMVDLPNLFVTSRQAFVCMDREEEVIRFPVSVRHARNGAETGPLQTIELAGVRVSFPEAKRPALEQVDCTLRRGETVAVVGAVGAGKTTLLRLLSGLVLPDEGEVRINGIPSARIAWDDYRRRVGYAPQESLLFSETIRENVELGREHAGPAGRAVEARSWFQTLLDLVHLDEEIRRFPLQEETVLGQKGTRVSGGQRQRISIARALFARPELILFDDATASLDAKNEDRLWNGLRELAPEAIVVVVSHRIATVARADRILVLDRGRLIDSGTHDELAGRCEPYRRFRHREEGLATLRTAATAGFEPPA